MRWESVANFTKETIIKQNLSLFSLQESVDSLQDITLQKLNKDIINSEVNGWALVRGRSDKALSNRNAILYNQAIFELIEVIDPIQDLSVNEPLVGVKLRHKTSKEEIVVFSGYGEHNEDPEPLRFFMLNTASAYPNTTVAFIGDWNNRFANTSIQLMDNGNNLIPPAFRDTSTCGIYDSTDAMIVVKNGLLTQMPSTTVNQTDPSQMISQAPNFSVSRNDNPYRRVFTPENHAVPVGNGMNALAFAKGLLEISPYRDSPPILQFEIHVALRTNEKKMILYSSQPISTLENIGLKQENGRYQIEFAYPNQIQNDWIEDTNATNQHTFYVRTENGIRSCVLFSYKEIIKDIGVLGNLIGVSTGSGAALGALLGTFAFPGIGTALGAGVGAAFGAAIGITATGFQSLIRNRLVGGLNPKEERIAAGFLTSLGILGLGAVIGTFILPGIGTLIGCAPGLGIGVLASICTAKLRDVFHSSSKRVAPDLETGDTNQIESEERGLQENNPYYFQDLRKTETQQDIDEESSEPALGAPSLNKKDDDNNDDEQIILSM